MLPIIIYTLSGFTAIGYEVLWTRILTPTLGTFVYAFAGILAVYLLGIAVGSLIYPAIDEWVPNKKLFLGLCQLTLGTAALGSVYLVSNQVVIPPPVMVMGMMVPVTLAMGLTFPAAVALLPDKNQAGWMVGVIYFGNTLGSVAGGLATSFLLIPLIGSSQSVVLLAIVNLGLAAILIPQMGLKLMTLGLVGLSLWLVGWKRQSLYPSETQWRVNWAKEKEFDFVFAEDEVASVFGYKDPTQDDQNLFIDGVATTNKVGETKLMAHVPVLLHPDPKRVLVIAFGMGTTFRSSLSYDLETDAVELVPSVPPLMRLFYADAAQVLNNPQGRVIINDGRNYVFLTDKHYDIVTIDPPPPFNSAGTTVLYSEEFYRDIAKKLNPGGIVSQWMWFGSRQDDIAMATKSFLGVFPYVMAFQSPRGEGGMFLEGSFSPIDLTRAGLKPWLNNQKAKVDLREAYPDWELTDLKQLVVGNRQQLTDWVGQVLPVTDEYPRTEYFLLRHYLTKAPNLAGAEVDRIFQ
jgi:spermidine synthase